MRNVLALIVAGMALAGSWRMQAQGTPTLEERYRQIPDAAAIGRYMERLSARPHHVGAPYTKDIAEWMLARFREWGWEARIETYDVLFPTPKERLLEMTAPARFKATLEEPAVAADPTSGQKAEQLPTYNIYSIDGDVTAPLVYVNYGRPEDYDELDALGISVRGAIVIARYGGSFRGTKPKIAAEHGAIGCLIYSDPRDDGYYADAVFPTGPMRSKDGVQRGSVMDLPTYSGDPLTPGIAAVPGAKRLSISEAATITKIPVLPISYGDAQPLLAAMSGPIAPAAWRGALPITYRLGPGPAQVHLKVSFNWETKPLYNVVATIPGSTFPDEWIVRGNHHDAWVNGAADPVSGMAPELEEARALGQLVKEGWRPKRTIVYAAWDGEEPGLIGSTEYVEQHHEELRRKAVVYINSDGNGRGFLQASGSHTLEQFVNDVARSIEDPETKGTVWARWKARRIADGPADRRAEARSRANLRIGALGSGSDYTPFLQHHGVASLNLSFGGFDDDGIYHSIYDDFYHFTKFSDPGFLYRPGARAVCRHGDAAPCRRRHPALRVHRSCRHGADLCARGAGAPQAAAGRGAGAESSGNRWRVCRCARPEAAASDSLSGRDAPGAQLRAARERRVGAHARGRPLSQGRGCCPTGACHPHRAASGDQYPADPERAAVHRRAGVAAPQLVPPSPLRARVLHRVRRENDAGCAGGH